MRITHQNGNKLDLVCNSRAGVWYAETGLHTKMEKRLIWCVILERACSLQRPDYTHQNQLDSALHPIGLSFRSTGSLFSTGGSPPAQNEVYPKYQTLRPTFRVHFVQVF